MTSFDKITLASVLAISAALLAGCERHDGVRICGDGDGRRLPDGNCQGAGSADMAAAGPMSAAAMHLRSAAPSPAVFAHRKPASVTAPPRPAGSAAAVSAGPETE
jgi:hypothetical protein